MHRSFHCYPFSQQVEYKYLSPMHCFSKLCQLEFIFPKSCGFLILACFNFAHRAFDTLAKALNTTDSSSPPSLADGIDTSGGGSIHVISRDQSTPIIEVEGPLLSDTHVTFKVSVLSLTMCFQPTRRGALSQS